MTEREALVAVAVLLLSMVMHGKVSFVWLSRLTSRMENESND